MKPKSLFIISMLVCVLFGCNKPEPKPTPGPQGEPAPEEPWVIKFKDPSYKNYIVANYYGDFISMGDRDYFKPDGCWKTMQGRCPYIELADDYLLLDWRWPAYWPSPVLLLVPWQEQTSWLQRWDTTTAHVFQPWESLCTFSMESFDLTVGNSDWRYIRELEYMTNFFEEENGQDSEYPENLEKDISTRDVTKGMTFEEVEAYYDAVYAQLAHQLDSLISIGEFPLECMYQYTY